MTLAFSPDCLCTKCWAIFHKCCTSMKTPLFSSSWLYLDCLQVIPPCCLLPAAGDVVGMGTGSFSMFPAAQLKRAGKTWTEHLLLHSRVFSQRLGHQKQGKGCDAVMDFPSPGQPSSSTYPFLGCPAQIWVAAALELVPAVGTSQRGGAVGLLSVPPHLENGLGPPGQLVTDTRKRAGPVPPAVPCPSRCDWHMTVVPGCPRMLGQGSSGCLVSAAAVEDREQENGAAAQAHLPSQNLKRFQNLGQVGWGL